MKGTIRNIKNHKDDIFCIPFYMPFLLLKELIRILSSVLMVYVPIAQLYVSPLDGSIIHKMEWKHLIFLLVKYRLAQRLIAMQMYL